MSRIRIMGLALVVVFAVGAIASVSASAAELEYTVFPNPITKGTQVGESELETKAGRDVKCTSGSTTTGTIESAKIAAVKSVVFRGCKSPKFGGGACQSTAAKGEIKTNELESELVYPVGTRSLHTVAAVVFKPKSGAEFAKFECDTLLGTETLKITGSLVCHIEPVNIRSLIFTLKCVRSASAGIQDLTEYENEAGTVTTGSTLKTQGSGPETFAAEQSSQKSTTEIEVGAAMKIKA
jgi:hypothetical protein